MTTPSRTPVAPPDVYRARRAQLAASISRPLALFSGHAPGRNVPTNAYPFRAGSTYLYFGGPPIEGACLVIEPSSRGDAGCALFRIPADPDETVWTGAAPDDATLAAAAGIEPSHVLDLEHLGRRYCDLRAAAIAPENPVTQRLVAEHKFKTPTPDERSVIIGMRLVKDEHELQAMRRAAAVTVEAHRAAIGACTPGRREADCAAAFASVLEANECFPAFTPIITIRGEVLHRHGHGNRMSDGDVLLIDGGAELPDGYACDVTRVCPVGGTFGSVQRQLYDTVLSALRRATAACTAGTRYRVVHDVAARAICEGLVEAELLTGDPAELARRSAHALFFPHGVGHLIGMEAHDMEDYGDQAGYAPGRSRDPHFGTRWLRLDRDLVAGMTVTVEPGIYLVPAIWARDDLVDPLADTVRRKNVDRLLAERFGGIRLEDTVCVQPSGPPEILSSSLELEADDVARLTGRDST